ncbi:MAG: hypothetical protein AAF721_34750 [Myxococcota bacterium]
MTGRGLIGLLLLAACEGGPGTYNETSGSDGPLGEADVGDGGGDDGAPATGGMQTGTGSTSDGTSTTSPASDSTGSTSTGLDPDAPQPSLGCGGTTLAPGEYISLELDHGSLTRRYDVHVPDTHDGVTPLPLILELHGANQSAAAQEARSGMQSVLESGWVLARPRGTSDNWNGGVCCGPPSNQNIDDVDFVRALVLELGTTLCLDERRIFAAGFASGGFMVHRLACEASDVVAAVSPVAGVLGVPASECMPARAVPLLHFHGTEDPLVMYGGGPGIFPHIGVEQSASEWVAINGCGLTPETTFDMGDTTCRTWSGCNDEAVVSLCVLDGAGHCWPGEAECPTPLPATAAMLDFFASHPMP